MRSPRVSEGQEDGRRRRDAKSAVAPRVRHNGSGRITDDLDDLYLPGRPRRGDTHYQLENDSTTEKREILPVTAPPVGAQGRGPGSNARNLTVRRVEKKQPGLVLERRADGAKVAGKSGESTRKLSRVRSPTPTGTPTPTPIPTRIPIRTPTPTRTRTPLRARANVLEEEYVDSRAAVAARPEVGERRRQTSGIGAVWLEATSSGGRPKGKYERLEPAKRAAALRARGASGVGASGAGQSDSGVPGWTSIEARARAESMKRLYDEVRAQLIWGASAESLRARLIAGGNAEDLVDLAIKDVQREQIWREARHRARRLIIGLALVAVGMIWLQFAGFPENVFGILILLGLFSAGVVLVARGLFTETES